MKRVLVLIILLFSTLIVWPSFSQKAYACCYMVHTCTLQCDKDIYGNDVNCRNVNCQDICQPMSCSDYYNGYCGSLCGTGPTSCDGTGCATGGSCVVLPGASTGICAYGGAPATTPTPVPTAVPTAPPPGFTPPPPPPPTIPPPPPTVPPPAPPFTFNVRAKIVDSTATTCNDIAASTQYASGTGFSSGPPMNPVSQTQNAGNYVTWNNVQPGSFIVVPNPPAGYSVKNACYTRNGVNPPTNSIAFTGNSGNIITMDVGVSVQGGWVQTSGGDAMVCKDVKSIIPPYLSTRFNSDGAGGFPGVVSYGTTYDFNSGYGTGGTVVSSTNWLSHDSPSAICSTNWYQYFANRFDIAGLPTLPAGSVNQPAAGNYRVNGSVSIDTPWNVNNQSIVVFVDGKLWLNNTVNINGNGFVAFVVNGDIEVAGTVGTPAGTASPSIEGIYITDSAHTFISGPSLSLNKERLVVKGTVVAGTFTLQRTLNFSDSNFTTPGELFIYNPDLLMNLPDQFKDIKVKWSEVAP